MDQSLSSGRGHVSVLSCFPPSVGKDVVVAVVKPLRAALGNPDTCSRLYTDRQVKWTMEVLCYGLTLPLDGDTVKLCVDVYTDWLMALVSPRDSIPLPISREPDLYIQQILRHLISLFVPRSDQVSPVYLSLCQQVLCAVQTLARDSAVMSRDTWETLLHFLLRINHTMLAPSNTTGVVSEQLSHLSMVVLFEMWLLSCSRCFPSRSLWLTGRQMLSSWRHQPVVVEQWCRVNTALTSRLLLLTFGPAFPRFEVPDEDAALIPVEMDDQRVSHTWFRFLHLLSNPVDLSRHVVVGSTPSSQEEALRGDSLLPKIFFRAMRGVSTLVDAFLGVTVVNKEPTQRLLSNTGIHTLHTGVIPAIVVAVAFVVIVAVLTQTDQVNLINELIKGELCESSGSRTRVCSGLCWIRVAVTRSPFKDRLPSYGLSRPRSGSAPPTPVNILSMLSAPPSTTSPPPHSRQLKPANVSKATSKPPTTSSSPHHWKTSSQPLASITHLCSSPRPSPSTLRCNVDSLLHLFGCWLFDAAQTNHNRWAAGRSEACGTLCRIFTCKKTAEDILPVYLSRFYLVLLQGLQVSEEACPPVLASILLNSTCLFCCDLKGVNLLLPAFISAVENVLLDRDLLRFKNFVSPVDLRRASIFILLSLLPLPLHFSSVQSEVLLDGQFSGGDVTAGTYQSLKPRLISVLIEALHTETDASNTQIILAAMLNLVQDLALLEAAGQPKQKTKSQHGGAGRSQVDHGNQWNQKDRGTNTILSDSAGILWVEFVHLLTQRLTAQWRNDSAVCLSALEVLGGLAKVEVSVEQSERRRALSSVCCYIEFQCSRPPPLHSRDLHSIIVAAFTCLNTWITHHPAMLDQQECLLEVLEIVELGISGTKSKREEEVRCKEEKELNPVSLRVKEAAEVTLNCVMQVLGAVPSLGGLLDEDALIGCHSLSDSSLKKKFRYFVLDSSVIMAMLEQPQGPEDASCPSLALLIRGPSGRHTWTLQLHLQPREGRTHTQHFLIPARPAAAQEDAGIQCSIKNQQFLENIERVPSVKADQSIPALHETVTEEMRPQLERLQTMFQRQQQVEAQPQLSGQLVVMETCRPPPPVTGFQTARLFLSHLGLLTPETLKDPGTSGVLAQLVSLDSSLHGFSEDLKRLDQLPSRNCDSAFIFYIRAGQRTAAEILSNVESSSSVLSHFLDFLSSLGRPVEVRQHQVGRVSTNSLEFPTVLSDSGGGVFDGEKFILMYADALTEITFIVPSSSSHKANWQKNPEEVEPPTAPPSNPYSGSELRPDSTAQPTNCSADDVMSCRSVCSLVELKVLIVWVERFEDIERFPLSDLLSETSTHTHCSGSNFQLIFIHPLKTGLYRICFHGNATSKFGLVVPLVNGSVVSKRSLGFLVREMVINCCHRRRLDSDSAHLPHIIRKHTISDIIHRYRSCRSEPSFYSALFQDP
ncbi:LOW QUALITY PROTEIN: ral GTPase-activating protein subunit beta [Sparus aurata]|uniref:LOW QUALITY PROTEIN: ral GTPase-activating protein subunit beta n=1 Tax=Sparus aurata TaxID=8175 RepID=UPI0011C187B2|nr:LOW QUALITY PROTEIN: ral GTPase-activating protein subunit beta-like [Sparus aurata]